jgi:glyoxylase-like metal-dependent hydrolase (beta-lactamase superfamily II)
LAETRASRGLGLILRFLMVGQLDTDCYILGDEESREAVVIDPGDDVEEIVSQLEADRLKVVAIVNTHGHFDHILANAELARRTQAPVCVHRADAPLLTSPGFARAFGFADAEPLKPDRLLEEGEEVAFGRHRLRVIHTPGHSPGGIALLLEEGGRKMVFVGDTLFYNGVGRTDLPGSSTEALLASIQGKLFPLGDDTIVYPGHGPDTTIGRERAQNPFLR